MKSNQNQKRFRDKVLETILNEAEPLEQVVAAWEGGAAANNTLDEFSDIDLCFVVQPPLQKVLSKIESSLQKFGISHGWQAKRSPLGDNLIQKVIVLKEAPRFFSVDVSLFDLNDSSLLKEFMQIERHGLPRILFDKKAALQPELVDAGRFRAKNLERVEEIVEAFPIFKTLVLKELERGHPIDALGFYQNALVRPFIEVLGMLYRPFRSDFGMRYTHSTFPKDIQDLLVKLNYVAQMEDLPSLVKKVEKEFFVAVQKVRSL